MVRKPASVVKVMTTYAALLKLGFDYRWPTKFYISGRKSGTILRGDLVVKGFGDPTLSNDDLDSIVKQINNVKIETKYIASIGGGINLRPNEFKAMNYDIHSPKIKDIRNHKNRFSQYGDIQKSGNWIRNNIKKKQSNFNLLLSNKWNFHRIEYGNQIEYLHHDDFDNSISVIKKNNGDWEIKKSINSVRSKIKYNKENNFLFVDHFNLCNKAKGIISKDKKNYRFVKY